jgi:hypothetical protein
MLLSLAQGSIKGKCMKMKWTAREFTMMIGVIVALIVILTLWVFPNEPLTGQAPVFSLPKSPTTASVIRQVIFSLF